VIHLRLVTYRTRHGIAQRWRALDGAARFCGYGKTRQAALVDLMPDRERRARFGHLNPPGSFEPTA
jgi:hypothetical protein